MKRNKYLEELGLKKGQYGLYKPKITDKRRKEWKEQRKKYGFDEREHGILTVQWQNGYIHI